MVAKGIRVTLKNPILFNGGWYRAKKASGRNRTDDRRFTNTLLTISPQSEAKTTVFQLPMTCSFYINEEPSSKAIIQKFEKNSTQYVGSQEKAYTFLLAPTDAFPSEQKQESGVPCL